MRLSQWLIAMPSAKIIDLSWNERGFTGSCGTLRDCIISGAVLLISAEPSTNFRKQIIAFLKWWHVYSMSVLDLQGLTVTEMLKDLPNLTWRLSGLCDASQLVQHSAGLTCIPLASSVLSPHKYSSAIFASCPQTESWLTCLCQSHWETWNTQGNNPEWKNRHREWKCTYLLSIVNIRREKRDDKTDSDKKV